MSEILSTVRTDPFPTVRTDPFPFPFPLVANCRLHGVEPHAYLKDVLERLPTATNQTVAQLTPLNWKKARQSPLKIAA